MEFINNSDYFDQHFLTDDNIIDIFISSANLTKDDEVIEIGPGKGNISELIAKKVKKLYCIELDERLKPFLDQLEKKYKNVKIIYGSALNTDWPKCNKIITSLPYSIIEPFINKAINYNIDIYMIMGKNYVDNAINCEINKLSLLTNCYYNSKNIIDITPDKFNPKPGVMSSIIELKYKNINDINDDLLLIFRYMFYYKNKKTKNALIESLISSSKIRNKVLTQKSSKYIVDNLKINDDILNKTFETISNEELKILYNKVKSIEL